MAMVYKSKKNLLEPLQKSKDEPGPGEYIPQTKYKKIKLSREPFLSSVNGTVYRKNVVPGPGSYYQDDVLIKFLKNIQNQRIFNSNDQRSLSQQKISNSDINETKEKLGFNSKSKRFNYILIKTKGPGPGYYFPNVNKYYKNKIMKIKEDEFFSKERQKKLIRKAFNLIPTIPSKTQKFGFDILKDGQLLQKQDPNSDKLFTGEKGDTVGPGTYEVDMKNEIYKSSPQWSMSKEQRKCYITNAQNMSKIDGSTLFSTYYSDHSTNFNNSNLLSSITASKFFIDDNLKIIELTPYNISNYNISNYGSQNLNDSDYHFRLTKAYPNRRFNRINKHMNNNTYNNEKYKIINSREILEKDDSPGPGFYIDRFKRSSFAIKGVPECNQCFGSKKERFDNINKNTTKIRYDFININDNSNNINKKSKSLLNLAPFSSTEERFKVPINYINRRSNPSPCDYNPKKSSSISFSTNEVFNSCEKRFPENEKTKNKRNLPGPGYYNPSKIQKHISTKKFDFNGSNRIKNQKRINNINKINKKDILSPINYFANTIEYNNNKKVNATNLENVTFFKCKPKFAKSMSSQNVGPGSYFLDKKNESKKIYPPFNSTAEKKMSFSVENSDIKTGPGKYDRDSYFDWNKKTFNISYA